METRKSWQLLTLTISGKVDGTGKVNGERPRVTLREAQLTSDVEFGFLESGILALPH